MRLIDVDLLKGIPIKDKLERNYQTFNLDDAYEEGWFDAIETIDKVPTVDAEPIRHGRWVMDKGYNECSICGCNEVITPYCPYCGAKMDEVEE